MQDPTSTAGEAGGGGGHRADATAYEAERQRLVEAEREARLACEAAQAWAAFLGRASGILASSLDHTTTLARVADLVVPQFADWCFIDILGPGDSLERLAVAHANPAHAPLAERFRRMRGPVRHADMGASAVIRTGRSQMASRLSSADLHDVARDGEHLEMIRRIDPVSYIAVPLVARERLLGTLTLVSAESGRRYEEGDLARAEDLARLAALAIDNARLFRNAQVEATRFGLLSEASEVLTTSHDYEVRLGGLARLCTQWLADACAVDFATPDGALTRLTGVARDPRYAERALEMERRYPSTLEAPAPNVVAFRTGEPQLYETISDEVLRATAVDEEHLALLRGLELHSLMCVPMLARGRTLGVISLVSHTPGRHFTGADLELAVALAHRAAIAVDNARLYAESQEANRAKSEFLAVMSHELRTPLTAIMGYTELVADGIVGEVTEKQRNHLERVLWSAQQLLRLIEEILSFAKMEAGKTEPRVESFDARRVVQQSAGVIADVARRKELELHVDIPEAPLPMRSDPGRLQQILVNLLTNAIKFTERGSVSVTVRGRDERVEFVVSDTGMGIEPEFQDLIFEPFRQLEKSGTRTAGGIGLGLSVVRTLATLLGGEISVESATGQGSTFRVSLPAVLEVLRDRER